MRLISWNVNRRTTLLAEQAVALASRAPDVVALQEVTTASLLAWRAAMPAIGLPHLLCTLDAADRAREPARRRLTGVLIAAREPLSAAPEGLPVPWPEAALGVYRGSVEIHAVHVPNAANGWVKVHTLQGIRAGLTGGAGARVLCGDLNTPRRELPDGTVVSFARDSRARLRPERGVEWDQAELGVVPGLRDLGFADAFRALHGYARREPSWTWRRVSGHGGGWRLDHVFASAELRPTACVYHHGWRDRGLSDHSAIEADVVPACL